MNTQLDNLLTKIKSRLYEGIPLWWGKEYFSYRKTYNKIKFNCLVSTLTIIGVFVSPHFFHLGFNLELLSVFGSAAYFSISIILYILMRSFSSNYVGFHNLICQQIKLNDIAAYEFCEKFISQYLHNEQHVANGPLFSLDTSLTHEELTELMSVSFNKAQLESLSSVVKFKNKVTLNDLLYLIDLKEKEYSVDQYNDIFKKFAEENNLVHIKQEYEEESSYKKYL